MTCFIAQNELSAFADDALETARAAELQAHLSGCSGCTRELQEIRRVRTMLRALPVQRAPVDFLAKVKAKAQRKSILERVGAALEPLLRLPRPAQAGLALAASLVIAITVFINPATNRGSLWDSASAPGAAVSLSEVANVQATSTPLALANDFAKRTNLDVDTAGGEKNEGLADESLKQIAGAKTDGFAAQAPPPHSVPGDQPRQEEAQAGGRIASLPAPTPAFRDKVSATPMPMATSSARVFGGSTASGSAGSGSSAYNPPTNPGLYSSTPQSIAAAVTPRAKGEAAKPAANNSPNKSGAATKEPTTEVDAREPAYESSASFSEPSMDSSVMAESGPSASDDWGATDRLEEKSSKTRDAKDKDALTKKEIRRTVAKAGEAPVGVLGRGQAGGDSAPAEGEMPSAATGSVAVAAPAGDPSTASTTAVTASIVSAKYLSAASTAPQDVVAAAKAVGGKLVSPASTPPGLGKVGASTVVTVEIPAAGVANFEAALRDAGTLERGTLPSGAVRYRIEVVRQ